MIISDFNSWEQEKQAYAPILQEAITYLKNTDLHNMALGRYDLRGDDMYIIVEEAKTVVPEERKSEHHTKYIDVQMVITGEEIHRVAKQSEKNKAIENELETKDYALYDQVENEMDIHLKPGMFAVYFPSDLHRPACSQEGATTTKRAVVKINKILLV